MVTVACGTRCTSSISAVTPMMRCNSAGPLLLAFRPEHGKKRRRMCPKHVPIDGILIGEHSLRQSLADDRDAFFALHVGLIEIAPRNDGNAQRGKKSRRDDAILRARILFAGRVIVTIRAKLQSGTGAGIAPGSNHPEGGFIDARKRINATNDFLIKIDKLLARLPVKHSGDVDGEKMTRVHTGL